MRLPIFTTLFIAIIVSASFSQPSREISKTLPLKPNGRLVIDTYKGSVNITTYDKPQVEIYVKIESDDSDPREAAQDIEDTEIEIHSSGNEVRLHTNYNKVERNNHYDFWDWLSNIGETSHSLPLVHYTIKMPRTAELKIKDYKSDSHIEGVSSIISFNTYKGTLDLFDCIGGVDLETYKGDARISFTKLTSDSHFETYKGKITVDMPKQAGFELKTDFEKRVEFSSTFDVEKHEHGKKHHSYYDYYGKINGGGPTLNFTSTKGDIQLRSR
jgi:hypothetical protein